MFRQKIERGLEYVVVDILMAILAALYVVGQVDGWIS